MIINAMQFGKVGGIDMSNATVVDRIYTGTKSWTIDTNSYYLVVHTQASSSADNKKDTVVWLISKGILTTLGTVGNPSANITLSGSTLTATNQWNFLWNIITLVKLG